MPRSRHILLAASLEDARRFQESTNDHDFYVVPLRSLERARGITADSITWTPAARADARYERAMEELYPCILARESR